MKFVVRLWGERCQETVAFSIGSSAFSHRESFRNRPEGDLQGQPESAGLCVGKAGALGYLCPKKPGS